eukprot:1195346-Prorocentrum_minimum.AAC.5
MLMNLYIPHIVIPRNSIINAVQGSPPFGRKDNCAPNGAGETRDQKAAPTVPLYLRPGVLPLVGGVLLLAKLVVGLLEGVQGGLELRPQRLRQLLQRRVAHLAEGGGGLGEVREARFDALALVRRWEHLAHVPLQLAAQLDHVLSADVAPVDSHRMLQPRDFGRGGGGAGWGWRGRRDEALHEAAGPPAHAACQGLHVLRPEDVVEVVEAGAHALHGGRPEGAPRALLQDVKDVVHHGAGQLPRGHLVNGHRLQHVLVHGICRSSLDARKPQNPIDSEEYLWHLQVVLYST